MLNMSYSNLVSVKNNEHFFQIIWTDFVNKFLIYYNAVGGCNFAQLTAWALYFDRAVLQAVHYFAERWKLTL